MSYFSVGGERGCGGGGSNTLSYFMVQKPELSAELIGLYEYFTHLL